MKYYSEETVKGLLEQMDSHFVKYLENLPSIEIEEPHGRLVDADSVKKIIRNDVSSDCDECVGYTCGLIDEMPTVIEASN